MSDIKNILGEFVDTYNNPSNGYNIDTVMSKFPELKGYNKTVLGEFVDTYNNPDNKYDLNVVLSKFPEFQPKKVASKPADIKTETLSLSDTFASHSKRKKKR